jgi:predicted N-acetyltransferase YhbS
MGKQDGLKTEALIRLERPSDYEAVERLTYEAFETAILAERTRTVEHYLAHIMRGADCFVPELDFVGETASGIVSSIFFNRLTVMRPDGSELETLTFGPVSVRPGFQRQGLGSSIIRHALDRAGELGHGAVIIIGHPEYYPRFGFKPAGGFNLTVSGGQVFDAFQALEIEKGFLGALGGECQPGEVFGFDREAFEAWNEGFLERYGSGAR